MIMSTTFHAWPHLPDELKLEVLGKHLTFPVAVKYVHHRHNARVVLSPLIATGCRHFVALALEAYYKNNIFELHLGLPSTLCPGM